MKVKKGNILKFRNKIFNALKKFNDKINKLILYEVIYKFYYKSIVIYQKYDIL